MAKYVKCDCGFEITTETEDEFVQQVQAHGKEVHNMDVTRAQALSMAQDV